MKVAILGATRGMGRCVARQLAERGDSLFLLGRNPEDLERSARDLEQRAGGTQRVGTAFCDLEDPAGFDAALDAADESLGQFDVMVVTAGFFATQDALERDRELCRRLVTVNFANTIVFCEAVRERLLARGGGTLCVLSSVAGDRARKPVVLYGASKAGLSAYLEGLDHKYRSQNLFTVCIKPGFVRTSMTEGLKPPPFAGDPEHVARIVVRAIDQKTPVRYAPRIWALILLVIRSLPRFVMRRIGF